MNETIVKSGDRIGDVASAALAEADNDIELATDIMEQRVHSDASLFRALMTPLVRFACCEKVQQVRRRRRESTWNTIAGRVGKGTDNPAPSAKPGTAETRADTAIKSARHELMEMTLISGVRLGEADAPELEHSIEFYRKQARNMSWKERFFSAIRDRLGEGQMVSEALTEQDLLRIQEDTNV